MKTKKYDIKAADPGNQGMLGGTMLRYDVFTRFAFGLTMVLTLALAESCSYSEYDTLDNLPVVCTDAGCFDGLTVQIEGTLPTAFVLEAVAPAGPPVIVECPDSAMCGSNIFLEGFTPEEVTIRLSFDSDSVSETFNPFYETNQPNGPDCPPECLVASVTVLL